MTASRETKCGMKQSTPTEAHRHQRSRKFSVKNTSPVPSEDAVLSRFSMMRWARVLRLGARHEPDVRIGAWEVPRALFASGTLKSDGERARLTPTVENPGKISTSTDSSAAGSSPRRLQGLVGSSRTIIVTPGVPENLLRIAFFDTHAPQTKDSYSVPEISGGERSEDDVSEAVSSFASTDCSVISGFISGDGSIGVGSSRRLQHDS